MLTLHSSLAEKAPPDNPRLMAGTLIRDALKFVHGADVVAAGSRDWLPAYFLLGRALELAFKAYLIARGATANELKQGIGHDLLMACPLAAQAGLSVRVDGSVLASLNTYYSEGTLWTDPGTSEEVTSHRKALEYAAGTYDLPDPVETRRLVDRVVNAAFRAIYGDALHEARAGRADAGLVMPEGLWGNPPPP